MVLTRTLVLADLRGAHADSSTKAKITKKLVDRHATEPGRPRHRLGHRDQRLQPACPAERREKLPLRYRSPEGEERHPTIGRHGAITPDAARAKAKEWQAIVFGGGDPLREKQERLNAATIGEVLDAYLGSEAFKAKALSTRLTDKSRVERHLKPLLARRPVDALTQEDIERAFSAIRDGKTAKTEKLGHRALARVRGGEGAARKSVRLLRSILVWAMRERLVKSNPAAGVQTGSDGSRDVILDDAESYGRLFRTLDRMEAEVRIRRPVADAIRVIALTGARRGEIIGLLWRHVDLKAGSITLPPAAHKTGKRTAKPRVIGLPSAAARPHRPSAEPRAG